MKEPQICGSFFVQIIPKKSCVFAKNMSIYKQNMHIKRGIAMSEKFTDKDGNEVTLITAENVEDFKNWLKNSNEPAPFNPEVAPDLKLADLIPANALLSKRQEDIATKVVMLAMKSNSSPERCAEFIGLASTSDTNRHIIGKAYYYMGRSTSNEFRYEQVSTAVKNTPDSKLIGFNLACYENNNHFNKGKPDDGKNLTSREKELLTILAEKNSRAVTEFVENGSLINADVRTPATRAVIDNAIYNNVGKVFADLDTKFVTKDILRKELQQYGRYMRVEPKDTANAKTQAEKNANILSKEHVHLQEAIMSLTEKQNKYDPSNYGRNKGLHERFTDLCKDMRLDDEVMNSPVMQKISLQIAQRDALEGNIGKLDETMLGKVIAADKSSEIAAKLPDEFIQEHKSVLLKNSPYLRHKNAVLNNPNLTYALPDMIKDNKISLSLKEKILDEAEKANAQKSPEKEALKKSLAMQSEDIRRVSSAYVTDTQNIQDAQKAVSEITAAYNKIKQFIKTDKNGNPIEAEAFLSASNINDLIANGQNPKVFLPQEGGLPLFGRSAEKERRQNLDNAITAFNQVMQAHLPTLEKSLYDDGSYTPAKQLLRGKILNKEADSILDKSYRDCGKLRFNSIERINKEYGNYDMRQRDLDAFEKTDKMLADARTQLNETKQIMKETAHELSGVKAAEAESKLQVVDNSLEGKDKANVRKANQAVVDPLAKKADAKTVLKAAMYNHGRQA